MPPKKFADRDLNTPSLKRMPQETPSRELRLAAHSQAIQNGEEGYIDPVNKMFVMTAKYLADKGFCCDSGCRHCPFEDD